MILGRDNAIHIICTIHTYIALVFSFFFLFFSGHFLGLNVHTEVHTYTRERVSKPRYLYLGMELRRGNVSQLRRAAKKKKDGRDLA